MIDDVIALRDHLKHIAVAYDKKQLFEELVKIADAIKSAEDNMGTRSQQRRIAAQSGDEAPNFGMGSSAPTIGDDSPRFKPCPFCGMSHTLKICTARQVYSSAGYTTNTDEAYTVICDATIGGCGANCGFTDGRDKAVSMWNNRGGATLANAS